MSAVVALSDQTFGALAAVLSPSEWDMLAVLNHHHLVRLTRRELMLARRLLRGRAGPDRRLRLLRVRGAPGAGRAAPARMAAG
jgi:hypothetical protein